MGSQAAELATREQRLAGLVVVVLGALNIVFGLVLVLAAMNVNESLAVLIYGVVVVVVGVLLVILGIRIRHGSQGATTAAIVVVSIVALVDVFVQFTGVNGQVLTRLVITALVLWLLTRAFRSV